MDRVAFFAHSTAPAVEDSPFSRFLFRSASKRQLKMQTKERYWEGLYWDGLNAEDVGAVNLKDGHTDDPAIQAILDDAKKRLQENFEQPENFWFTFLDFSEKTIPYCALRLWHENVFLGARASGVGDPGAKCRDLVYRVERSGNKISYTYVKTNSWEETEKFLDDS